MTIKASSHQFRLCEIPYGMTTAAQPADPEWFPVVEVGRVGLASSTAFLAHVRPSQHSASDSACNRIPRTTQQALRFGVQCAPFPIACSRFLDLTRTVTGIPFTMPTSVISAIRLIVGPALLRRRSRATVLCRALLGVGFSPRLQSLSAARLASSAYTRELIQRLGFAATRTLRVHHDLLSRDARGPAVDAARAPLASSFYRPMVAWCEASQGSAT